MSDFFITAATFLSALPPVADSMDRLESWTSTLPIFDVISRWPLLFDPIYASIPVVPALRRALSALDPARVPWIGASTAASGQRA